MYTLRPPNLALFSFVSGFYNLIIGSSLGEKTLASNAAVAGLLQINASNTLNLNGRDLSIGGNFVNNGGLTVGTGTVTFNGTSAISGSTVNSFYNLTISGTLTAPSGNMNVSSNFVNNGTFNHNNGTVTFNGTTTVSGSSTTNFRNVTISGTLTGHATNMGVSNNWVNNGIFNHNNGTVTFNGTTTLSGSGTHSFRNITISGALTSPLSSNVNVAGNWVNNGTYNNNSATVTFNGTTAMSGSSTNTFRNITISGTLTAPSTNMNVSGNWINSGTFHHNNGTITFNGTTPVTGVSSTNFYSITISGTLTAHPTSMLLGGNLINNGTFSHNSGTVTFNGTSTISGSSTTSFNNIGITGTLTGHISNINISGNMVNNGIYNSNNGLLTFNGAVAQTISGSGTGTFESLTLSNDAGLTVSSGTYSLQGVLTITAGMLTNSGTFTLAADATRYSRIDPIALGCGTCGLSGNFIVERYIPHRTYGTWANMSSPVANATMQDWDDDLFLLYPFGTLDPITNRPKGTNVLAYDEPSANYVELSTATPLTAGQGFEIGLTDDQTLTNFTARAINTTGTPNYGTFDIPLNYTAANGPPYPTGYSGQNLVGNPFASAIDLSMIIMTNVLPTVDVYDYTINNYRTLSGSDLIGPYQGFWAYAQSNGASITIPEIAKSTNTATALNRLANTDKPYLNLLLTSADGSHSMEHTLQIACNEQAQDGWDRTDHPFRKSPEQKAPSITSNAGKVVVNINTFYSGNTTYFMPLNVHVGINGNYSIRSTGIEHITKDYSTVLLEDKMTHTFTDLNKTDNYTFYAKTSDSKDRFALHFSKLSDYQPVNSSYTNDFADHVQIIQTQNGSIIKFDMPETLQTNISIVDLLGRTVLEPKTVDAFDQSVNLLLPANFEGIYLIVVNSAKGTLIKKFMHIN